MGWLHVSYGKTSHEISCIQRIPVKSICTSSILFAVLYSDLRPSRRVSVHAKSLVRYTKGDDLTEFRGACNWLAYSPRRQESNPGGSLTTHVHARRTSYSQTMELLITSPQNEDVRMDPHRTSQSPPLESQVRCSILFS